VATAKDGRQFAGVTLILNLPPAQLLPLAKDLLTPEDAALLASATLEPCWALLALLETDLAVDWPALELTDHPVFSWIARDHTKRGKTAPPTLLAHANARWTAAHLEESQATVEAELRDALESLLGSLAIGQAQAHRWRYAKPLAALGQPYFWDGARQLGACGDWCEGGRVEGAFLSGLRLAVAL
jgi:renalase